MFLQFLNGNGNEKLDVMRNTGMPKTSVPFKSFCNPDNQALFRASEINGALELFQDFLNSGREFRSYMRAGPFTLRNARFEKVFGDFTEKYLSKIKD